MNLHSCKYKAVFICLVMRCYVVKVENTYLEHTIVRTETQVCYCDDGGKLKQQGKHAAYKRNQYNLNLNFDSSVDGVFFCISFWNKLSSFQNNFNMTEDIAL